ncbi:MAG: efflux RND transporter periplasmic adaptor subunit [Vicinamibacterales bacterium]|jgi:membrane fusion protein (multidrug efflux system)|nr:efflux RND transporter periplasmic adaptor subunit [Vicinamibacterales bacterium]
MIRNPILFLCGVLLLAASACSKEAPPAAPPPPEVLVTEPIQRDVPVYMELVGQAIGFQDVEIRARVEGFLETVAFTEGSLVRKGQLLYRIDPKPLQAILANAKANMATSQARLEKAANDVKRLTPLAAQQAVSQQELDNATAQRDAAIAQVDANKAAVEKAEFDLGYTTIDAPLDGLIGTTKVKAGNLVGRGESTLLVTISQIDPILFRAGIAEAEYLKVARRMQEQQAQGIVQKEKTPIQLILADGSVHPHEGRLDAVERNIDTTTGTIALQIKFPNPERLVRPGQFGRVRFVIDLKKNALLVPQRAVQELQNLYSLAVVGPDNKVSFRNAKVGPREDSLWVIEEGLKPGERVIVEGLQRVREGLVVAPKAAPPAAAAPKAGEVK